MIGVAGRRSGDGDEVKHDADGSAASLLAVSCPWAVDAELLMRLLKAPVGVGQRETNVLTYWLTEWWSFLQFKHIVLIR